jgi:hypothetical protein
VKALCDVISSLSVDIGLNVVCSLILINIDIVMMMMMMLQALSVIVVSMFASAVAQSSLAAQTRHAHNGCPVDLTCTTDDDCKSRFYHGEYYFDESPTYGCALDSGEIECLQGQCKFPSLGVSTFLAPFCSHGLPVPEACIANLADTQSHYGADQCIYSTMQPCRGGPCIVPEGLVYTCGGTQFDLQTGAFIGFDAPFYEIFECRCTEPSPTSVQSTEFASCTVASGGTESRT